MGYILQAGYYQKAKNKYLESSQGIGYFTEVPQHFFQLG